MNAVHSEPARGRTIVRMKVAIGASPMMRDTIMKRLSTNWKLLLIRRNAVGSV